METKRLSFYTEGPGFTELLRSFIEEGKNFTVYQILRDGGFTESLSNRFLRGELKFTGTTQFGEDLGVEEDSINSTALLKQSLRSILSRLSETEYEEVHPSDFVEDFPKLLKKFINDADIKILKNAFGEEALFNCYRTDEINEYSISLINEEGYGVTLAENVGRWTDEIEDGVILPCGTIITCGYQEHSSLYPFLKKLGLVKVSCWTDCEETIHISSRSISGTIAHAIGHRWRDIAPTDAQLEVLFKLRRNLGTYGYDDNISFKLLQDCEELEEFGGKWNNLSYVKKFYKNIKTPRISKEPIEGVKNCLRTSPKYSLPGLLESVFNITENSVNEITETFEKFKDIRRDNKLNIFYQEYLEGSNGVLHYDRYGLRYDISSNRGDIVQGIKGNADISDDIKKELEIIGKDFYTDFDKPVQIEFVIKDNEVWLVQLRVLENNAEETVRLTKPDETLVTGKTFSKGSIEVDVDKILILDSDGDSELLLGKEALIVKGDVEFSHILALSKALRIPSIYATGDFELPQGKVKFTAYNKEAWITKI
jgi:hypothetical protein